MWNDDSGAGWHMMGGVAGGWILPLLCLFLALAVVAAFGYFLGRDQQQQGQSSSTDTSPRSDDAAIRILGERLARGDIDESEYAARRDLIERV